MSHVAEPLEKTSGIFPSFWLVSSDDVNDTDRDAAGAPARGGREISINSFDLKKNKTFILAFLAGQIRFPCPVNDHRTKETTNGRFAG